MTEGREPLVSILVPAYTPDFLEDALASAVQQTEHDIEIVVVDDRPGGGLDTIVRGTADERIRYHANERNLGSVATYERCFALARGTYVKFLNDDDLLVPHCVRRMLDAFERFGGDVTLVTSKRRLIDARGAQLPDETATTRLFRRDAYVAGFDLGSFALQMLTNFLGEPTTAMFRRKDLERNEPGIFVLNGRSHTMNVDVVMWLKLLLQGDAVYLTDELSSFRRHGGQEQRDPKNTLAMTVAWDRIVEDAHASGFLDDPAAWVEARRRCLKLFDRMLEQGGLAPGEQDALQRLRERRAAELGAHASGPRLPSVRRTVRRNRRRFGRPPLSHRFVG